MAARFSITTAIDYTNSAPHIGHAYEKILADVIARYRRLSGDEVFFLTGVDQHGQKVQRSAEKAGVTPAAFVGEITEKFIALWRKLEIRYDTWAATTDPLHKEKVQSTLQRLFDEGQIYRDKQAGHYSIRQEQFLTDKERNQEGAFGPEWGEVEYREEENYYFRLAQHREWLIALIDSRKNLVTPESRQTELRNAVERLSGDLCISRPQSRLNWGIPLPFDECFVTYVWFDALLNYITFAGYDPAAGTQPTEFRERWPALQIIGKDILIPAHGIYWLIMLHALGFTDDKMPALLVHGWWNISGAKISKSLGNVVDPNVLADQYGAEALRYYLMSDIATGKDADFSEERLISRYNSDLANSLGNLLNRTLSMTHRYRSGVLRRGGSDSPLPGRAQEAFRRYRAEMREAQVHAALAAVSEFATACNAFVETSAPWKLAKDPARAAALDQVLYSLAESLRIIAVMISPVLPRAAREICLQLNCSSAVTIADAEWGKLSDNHQLGEATPLFPRIDTAAT